MPNDPDQLLVAGDGAIYIAPVGTALPSDEDDTLNAAFEDVGYVTPDGVTYRDAFTQEVIRAWQALAAIRTVSTARDPQLTFAMMQWNEQNLVLAFGGGTVTEPVAGHFQYEGPAASDAPVERALVLDGIDGTNIFRFVFPRVGLAQGTEFNLNRSTEARLSVTLGILDPGGDDAMFTLFSNATGMEPAS